LRPLVIVKTMRHRERAQLIATDAVETVQ